MKIFTLLFTLFISYCSFSQTVNRLYRVEEYDRVADAWDQTEEETYTYGNEGTKETLLLNRLTADNGMSFTDNFRRLKTYNGSNSLTENIRQNHTGSGWENSTRHSRMYNPDGSTLQRLDQITDGATGWINQEKKDYEYPDEDTTVIKEYLYESDTWVQYFEDIITNTVSGFIQITKERIGGVLVNSDRTETIFVDGKLDEQISEFWDDTLLTPDWVLDTRYKRTYDVNDDIEKEEIFDWDEFAMPAAWKLTTQILYDRSVSNQVTRLVQDCDMGSCENIQRIISDYYPSGKIQTRTTEIWDEFLGVSGEWTDWSQWDYEYDVNDNNTKITRQGIDFLMPELGLQLTTESRLFWEEGATFSVSFSNEKLLSIYPNPTTEIINIAFKFPTTALQELSLYNTRGQLIKRATLKKGENNISIPISYQANGMYLLNIKIEDRTEVYKIIKH